MDLEPRQPPPQQTVLSSPNLATHDSLEEINDDIMMMDPTASALGVTGTFKQQAMKNSKGKVFWDTFSETSSSGATQRVTPPPPAFGLARASSSGIGLEDISMGSPSASSNGGANQSNPFVLPTGGTQTTTSSSGHGTPLGPPGHGSHNNNNNHSNTHNHNHNQNNNNITGSSNPNSQTTTTTTLPPHGPPMPMPMSTPPTAAEITRRINSKRRRDDDLDPVSIKRRAVSPGMSVHNSPVMQSPLQRDMEPWGGPSGSGTGNNGGGGGSGSAMSMSSRPGSVGGDSSAGGGGGWAVGRSGSGAGSENGSAHGGGGGGSSRGGGKVRVGFQGMVETNDGITRLSIE